MKDLVLAFSVALVHNQVDWADEMRVAPESFAKPQKMPEPGKINVAERNIVVPKHCDSQGLRFALSLHHPTLYSLLRIHTRPAYFA